MKEEVPDILEDLRMVAPQQPWWPWAVAGALIFLLLVGLVIWWRRREGAAPLFQSPPVPPEKTARERLESIRALIAEGRHREFVNEVSGVLRDYIEARFGLRAPHLSTEEFLYQAEKGNVLSMEHRRGLTAFLQSCDQVKFALEHLEVPGMETLYDSALRFVEQTAAAEPAAPSNPFPSAVS